MASTPTGLGYWLVASDGGIFSYGDAKFHGSTGNIMLNKPIVGMTSSPSGHGYWFVAADGGIFSYGDAKFHGSTGNMTLSQPIVGMTATRTGNGYWFVAADGGIFSYGDATFHGSASLSAPVVGMAPAAPAIPPATALAMATNPSASTGGVAFATQPVVHVLDAHGHTVSNSTDPVTLSIAFPPAGTVLTCDSNTVHAVAGVATFAGCSINKDGTYTLHVQSGDLSPTTSSVTITIGPAAKTTFTVEPSGAANGATFATSPTVAVTDGGGNTIVAATSVTLSINTPVNGQVLACTNAGNLTKAAPAGVAVFTGCSISGTAGTRTLHATTGAVSGNSGNVVTTAGAATQVVFSTAPAFSGVNGSTFTTSPTATVKDVSGNTVPTATSVVLSVNGTATLACTNTGNLTKAAPAGVAVFTGCTLTGAIGNDTITATNAGHTVTSGALNIAAAGAATQAVFSTAPAFSGVNGSTFTTSPTVTVKDVSGNTVTAAASVVLSVNGTGTLACTNAGNLTFAAGAGVAAYTGCTLTGVIGADTITATVGGHTVTSGALNIATAGAATQVVFSTAPAFSGMNGSTFTTSPTATVEDVSGNTVTAATSVVLSVNGTATLACTNAGNLTFAAGAGVAVFTGCTLTGAIGNDTITATNAGHTVTSGALNITTAGAATQVAFTTPAAFSGVNGSTFTTSPTATVEDVSGNTVTAATSVVLSVNGAATLACTNAGNLTFAAPAGVAAFTGCTLTGVIGNDTITATNAGHTVTSGALNIASAGAATQVAFTTAPTFSGVSGSTFTQSPVVTVEDVSGNTVTAATSVVLSVNGTGTLACTNAGNLTFAASAGVATYTGCTLTGPVGADTITATNAGHTITSGSLNITS